MTRMLLAIMALVVGVAFSAPAFADDTKKPAEEKKGEKKPAPHMIYADPDKKEEKKKDTKK